MFFSLATAATCCLAADFAAPLFVLAVLAVFVVLVLADFDLEAVLLEDLPALLPPPPALPPPLPPPLPLAQALPSPEKPSGRSSGRAPSATPHNAATMKFLVRVMAVVLRYRSSRADRLRAPAGPAP